MSCPHQAYRQDGLPCAYVDCPEGVPTLANTATINGVLYERCDAYASEADDSTYFWMPYDQVADLRARGKQPTVPPAIDAKFAPVHGYGRVETRGGLAAAAMETETRCTHPRLPGVACTVVGCPEGRTKGASPALDLVLGGGLERILAGEPATGLGPMAIEVDDDVGARLRAMNPADPGAALKTIVDRGRRNPVIDDLTHERAIRELAGDVGLAATDPLAQKARALTAALDVAPAAGALGGLQQPRSGNVIMDALESRAALDRATDALGFDRDAILPPTGPLGPLDVEAIMEGARERVRQAPKTLKEAADRERSDQLMRQHAQAMTRLEAIAARCKREQRQMTHRESQEVKRLRRLTTRYGNHLDRTADYLHKIRPAMGGFPKETPRDLPTLYTSWGADVPDSHAAILAIYEQIVRVAARAADPTLPQPPRNVTVQIPWSLLWAYLRQAHVFELREQDFHSLWPLLERYAFEHIAGHALTPVAEPSPCCGDEIHASANATITAAARTVAFPERVPFEVCYFAWGRGVDLTLDEARTTQRRWEVEVNEVPADRMDLSQPPSKTRYRLLAHLITSRGHVVELYLATTEDSEPRLHETVIAGPVVGFRCEHPVGPWRNPVSTLGPWLTHALVNIVNGFDSTMIARVTPERTRRDFRALSLALGQQQLPPPFYTVRLTSTTFRSAARVTALPHRRRPYGYRFDVRGHDIHHLVRGMIPLDPKLRERLLKRRYRIFSADAPLDDDAQRHLLKHRLPPPRGDEWLAIRTGWRESFKKGPPEKPYIPSTRRVPTTAVRHASPTPQEERS